MFSRPSRRKSRPPAGPAQWCAQILWIDGLDVDAIATGSTALVRRRKRMMSWNIVDLPAPEAGDNDPFAHDDRETEVLQNTNVRRARIRSDAQD
jgi:hypothetical protein